MNIPEGVEAYVFNEEKLLPDAKVDVSDMLNCRMSTAGIVEKVFQFANVEFMYVCVCFLVFSVYLSLITVIGVVWSMLVECETNARNGSTVSTTFPTSCMW